MKTNGFTLVELLVALAITGVVATAIGTTFIANLRAYTTQIEAVHTQQTLRATLSYLVNTIRMAGYKGTASDGIIDLLDGDDADRAGILLALQGQCRLAADLDNSGTLRDGGGEDIDIRLYDDSDGDGVVNGGVANNLGSALAIQYNGSSGYQTIAEGISAISFSYMLLNDNKTPRTYSTSTGAEAVLWVIPAAGSHGNWLRLDANSDGVIDGADNNNVAGDINCVDTGIPVDYDGNGSIDRADYNLIGAVRMTILGVVKQQNQKYVNAHTYVVGRHVIIPNDHLRRRCLSTCVTCRNMLL